MPFEPRTPRPRSSLLPIVITLLGGVSLLLLLIVLSGGLILYILLPIFFLGGIALFHYLLWGRSLTDETAGEREELEFKERTDRSANDDDWPGDIRPTKRF